ncbi:MAG TPA: cytochrome C oxidase subunit IV family protein [Polyangiaceae bacterium]|nr:cytochrome C oxidase subunit IV family protein [Polyangiaceae bacterium]
MSDKHEGNGHGGFAHVLPVHLLVGVWAALMVLTVITVTVTSIDLGRSVNLIIAMGIATLKAALVALYFMHLRWDRPFNALVFVSSLLFVSLFISIALLDKSEYEPDINDYDALQAQ